MKHLKKHPKQQRMEDMTTPDGKFINKSIKSKNDTTFDLHMKRLNRRSKRLDEWLDDLKQDEVVVKEKQYLRGVKVVNGEFVIKNDKVTVNIQNIPPGDHKVVWEGREWLRSINDDNGFTLMSRLAWRVVAVGVFVGAVIYFLSTR